VPGSSAPFLLPPGGHDGLRRALANHDAVDDGVAAAATRLEPLQRRRKVDAQPPAGAAYARVVQVDGACGKNNGSDARNKVAMAFLFDACFLWKRE
jgi:hypothetical protein